MKILNILLGAGFSVNAGLPLVGAISQRLDTDYHGKIVRETSSEWRWANDGEVPFGLYSGYSYLMNEVVSAFRLTHGALNNYEIFYDFIKSKPNSWYQDLALKAKAKFEKLNPKPTKVALSALDNATRSTVDEIVNYLIADQLRIRMDRYQLLAKYQAFIHYIRCYEKVNIHSLNHDLLAELLLGLCGIPFSDGFTDADSELMRWDTKEVTPTFTDHFPDNVTAVHKLHGSVNLNRYDVGTESGSFVSISDRYIYLKFDDINAKHLQVRIDPVSRETTQGFPPRDVVPKFITGLSKADRIKVDNMYSALFKRFEHNIRKPNDLLIIGYSYCDKHVNEIIQKASLRTGIRNINPSVRFPYTEYRSVTNYNYMDDKGALTKL